MNRLRTLFANRDADLVRTVVLVLASIVAASALVLLAGHIIGIDESGAVGQAFRAVGDSNWALVVVVVAFTATSFIGAPQFLLIALCVAVFGPTRGFVFAYLATMVAAAANFILARRLGAGWVRNRRPGTLKTVSEFVGRNGFFTAMIVRIVPSAPFVVVNMGLGLTTMPLVSYLAGTAVGIIPKTALIALLGKVVERAARGDGEAIAYLAAAVAGWLALALLARWVVWRRGRPPREAAATTSQAAD